MSEIELRDNLIFDNESLVVLADKKCEFRAKKELIHCEGTLDNQTAAEYVKMLSNYPETGNSG
jgi:hypothetical protein